MGAHLMSGRDPLAFVRLCRLQEMEMAISRITKRVSKVKTTVEEGGEVNMNEEMDKAESEINDLLSKLKTLIGRRGEVIKNEEMDAKESRIYDVLSQLKTTVGRGEKVNMNEEMDIAESEVNDMFSDQKTMEESEPSISQRRDQLFFEDCARTGLAQYNAHNGTDFELDKISGENHCEDYVHLNFIACSSSGSNNEKRRRMFYAEAVGFEEGAVTSCCILDPFAGMVSGCQSCGHEIYHRSESPFVGCTSWGRNLSVQSVSMPRSNVKYLFEEYKNTSEQNEAMKKHVMMLLSILRKEEAGGEINNQGEEKLITEHEFMWIRRKMEETPEIICIFYRSPIYAEWQDTIRMQQAKGYAKLALEWYNRQNGTNFELHDVAKPCFSPSTCSSDGILHLYCHMNFRAKSRGDSETSGMFFAELECKFFGEKVVLCCLLDPVTGMKTGCEFCGHEMHHPTDVVLCSTHIYVCLSWW